MNSSISVGNRTVAANNSTEFEYGEEIDLAGAVVLSLERADAPVVKSNLQKFAPDLAETWNNGPQNDDVDAATNLESQPPSKAFNSNTIQLAVIIFCFLMIPVMFIAKAIEKSPETNDQHAVTLEAIRDSIGKASEAITKAIAADADAASSGASPQGTADQLRVLEGFVDQLRLAKAYQLRGNIEQAKLIYDRLLKELLIRQNNRPRPKEDAGKSEEAADATSQDAVAKTEQMILSYIKRRRG
jgi:hypothetical protein